jgi:DNA-binding beta-propeller fold protein YncE
MLKWLLMLVLAQAPAPTVSGVLSGPDPAQMESAPELGYKAVPTNLSMPADKKMGAASSVAVMANGNLLVFNRGEHPLMEFDAKGTLVRAFGDGMYARPHGMRIDPEGNIWTTDVRDHTVIKLSAKGDVLLTLGTRGQAGSWNETTKLLQEPSDIAFGPQGDVFVVVGHGRGEGRVLRFDKGGKLITSWGGTGKAPGQFDQPHSILVNNGQVYVADRENRRVQIFDLNGKYISEWKFKGLPCGLYRAADGQLYLASGFSGQILRLDKNGKAVGMMGQPGKALGEFGEAHYMAMTASGDIYVADTINATLHKYVKK